MLFPSHFYGNIRETYSFQQMFPEKTRQLDDLKYGGFLWPKFGDILMWTKTSSALLIAILQPFNRRTLRGVHDADESAGSAKTISDA